MGGRSLAGIGVGALALVVACGTLQGSPGDGTDPPTSADASPEGASVADAASEAGFAIDAGDAGAYVVEVLADGPIRYYRLGEVAADAVAHDMVGPGAGTHVLTKRGVGGAIPSDPDTATGFDGTTADVVIPAAAMPAFEQLAPFTIEVWTKPATQPTSFQHLVTREWNDPTAGREGYALFIEAGQGFAIERYVDGANRKVIDATRPSTTAFAHVVATFNGSELALYVNAQQVGAVIADARPIATAGALAPIGYLGCGQTCDNRFGGVIDEVAMYDHVLSPARIQAHYAAGTR